MNNVTGSLIVVDANTGSPKVFWKGVQLLEVVAISIDAEVGDVPKVKLRVMDTASFDLQYSEMFDAGIIIRKVKHV